VFVTDLKGELYELTAGWRREHAHNRILRFEPAAAAGFESTQETPNQGPENN
jgi:type IV secretory pathway TraG/TraD family ATPase VirD4